MLSSQRRIPFFWHCSGDGLKWRYRCQFVAYLQDLYPDIAIALKKVSPSILTRLLKKALVAAYNRADRVVVLSPLMQTRCLQHGVESHRLCIIENWSDCQSVYPDKADNLFRKERGWENQFIVEYAGNLGLSHELDPIIDAAIQLADEPGILFLFVGEGGQKKALMERVSSHGLSNVVFLPYQSHSVLNSCLSAADVHLIALKPEADGCLMPSKLYSVLASGTAAVGICTPEGDLGRVITDETIGAVVDPRDRSSSGKLLAKTVREMKQQLDRNVRARSARKGAC